MTTASPDLGQIEQENRDALEVGTTATTAQKGRKLVPWRFFAGRAGFYLFTLWAAITINFFIPRIMPGDPVSALIAKNQTVDGAESSRIAVAEAFASRRVRHQWLVCGRTA